jgi:hypothetical protein
MSFINGTFSVVCSVCNTPTDFDSTEADFESTGGSERQMGPENGYSWESSFECTCGNEIEFDYQVHEYPVGAFNHESVDIKGAEVNQTFVYDFIGEPEEEEEEEDFD